MSLEDTTASLSDLLSDLLSEIGRVYAPAQLANARAVAAGEASWETEIDGHVWRQQTFPYQAKCLTWTRERYHSLTDTDRSRVDSLLSGSGCEAMFLSD